MYGEGISREGSVLDLSVEHDIIKKSGAWYTYDGEQMGQGRENAKKFLKENPEIMVEITDRVMSMLLPTAQDPELTDTDTDVAADDIAVDQIDGDQFSDVDDEPISLE